MDEGQEEFPRSLEMGPWGGYEGVLVNKQNLRLKTYFWPSSGNEAKATLLFVHGHGSHILYQLLRHPKAGERGVYEGSWVEHLNASGINVCGIDNQGCGESESLYGLRFYVERFEDYVDDVLQFALELKGQEDTGRVPRQFGHVPLFVGGTSLGGCISLLCTQQRPDLFSGLILLAPMLSLERISKRGLNSLLKPIGDILSKLTPTAALLATDTNPLHPEIQEVWDKDPLVSHMNTRVRNASEYLRVTNMVMHCLSTFDCPFIVFHSELDTMTDPSGSKKLYLYSRVREHVD